MFDKAERAMVEQCLRTDPKAGTRWLMGVVLGAVVAIVGILLLILELEQVSPVAGALVLVLGLVAIANALDSRKRGIVAGIVRKYEQRLKELQDRAAAG